MKKVLTILMSVLMLITIATTSVLADEPSTSGTPTAATTTSGTASTSGTDSLSGQETFDVKANITKSGGTLDDETVYDVVIEWEMVPAEYTSAGDTYHWNPSTLKYERTGTAASTITKTSDAKVSIKVINNSNAVIKYDIAYASASGKHTEEVNATGSSSGKLESAAPANPTLTGSPDASEAGASTSGTYTADVAFSSTSGVYTDTFATAGPVTMGTYTVNVGKHVVEYNVTFNHYGNRSGLQSKIYSFDGVNDPVEIDCDILMDEEATINTKYVIYSHESYGPGYVSSIDTGTCANLLKLSDLTDAEIAKLETISIKDYIYNGRTTDFVDNEFDEFTGYVYVFELIGDGEIKLYGQWHD